MHNLRHFNFLVAYGCLYIIILCAAGHHSLSSLLLFSMSRFCFAFHGEPQLSVYLSINLSGFSICLYLCIYLVRRGKYNIRKQDLKMLPGKNLYRIFSVENGIVFCFSVTWGWIFTSSLHRSFAWRREVMQKHLALL